MYPEFYYARQENAQYHETEILKLDSSKIRNQLGWNPLYKTSESLAVTLSWYLSQENREVRTEDQVQKYLQKQNKVQKI
jgi:CDP-glucose 4,6-dehydratase